ncbi:MAG TPA: TIGR03016 family PEP-CTERM system-associated outer membrane protein [Sedimenticola thiotaurini]|uniref:TIGR03016 family PEP-CTERM system-associated outer membrane protein n=1 Tax=Sedimenticola thiotaurini TaxID=1543721 RepID=A0A831WAB1_9GAMM|nr:TIGR03016 family PEP-CTERM system-associated outer membrane protein [Sedimenticola thiotaurini]
MARAGMGLVGILGAVGLLALAGNATAAKGWHTNYGLTTQVIGTDNVDLAPDGNSDLGIRIRPSVGIRRDARRNKLYFQYALDYLDYLDSSSSRDQFRHFLTANWNSELYDNVLFLDARANADQNLLVPFGRVGGDDFNNTRNTTQTFTYSISPYTKLHFKGFADLELRYTFDQVLYSDSLARDSYSNAVDLRLDSGREFSRTPWAVSGQYRRVRYDEAGGSLDFGRDSTYKTTLARLSYVIDRRWRPNVYVGYDNNDFATTRDEPQGAIYGAGVTWTPSPRTELDLAYGHRFFGNNWYMRFNHRQRKSVFRASLTHDIQSSRDEIVTQQTFQAQDPFGNPIIDPVTGEPLRITIDTPTLTNETYILSRFDLGYDLRVSRRDTASIGAYYTIRDYQVSRREENRYGVNANWSHGLAANMNANVRFWWETLDYGESLIFDPRLTDYDLWSISLGVTRQLTARTRISFDLSHLNRDSDSPLLTYTENRATVTLGTNW